MMDPLSNVDCSVERGVVRRERKWRAEVRIKFSGLLGSNFIIISKSGSSQNGKADFFEKVFLNNFHFHLRLESPFLLRPKLTAISKDRPKTFIISKHRLVLA